MLERFARAPDGLPPVEGNRVTPLPLGEAVSSLSAILLDDPNYAFIMAGRHEVGGLPWVGEDRMIPLKAIAWLDLNARQEPGAKDVRKHLKDVLRLLQLLAPAPAEAIFCDGRSDGAREVLLGVFFYLLLLAGSVRSQNFVSDL